MVKYSAPPLLPILLISLILNFAWSEVKKFDCYNPDDCSNIVETFNDDVEFNNIGGAYIIGQDSNMTFNKNVYFYADSTKSTLAHFNNAGVMIFAGNLASFDTIVNQATIILKFNDTNSSIVGDIWNSENGNFYVYNASSFEFKYEVKNILGGLFEIKSPTSAMTTFNQDFHNDSGATLIIKSPTIFNGNINNISHYDGKFATIIIESDTTINGYLNNYGGAIFRINSHTTTTFNNYIYNWKANESFGGTIIIESPTAIKSFLYNLDNSTLEIKGTTLTTTTGLWNYLDAKLIFSALNGQLGKLIGNFTNQDNTGNNKGKVKVIVTGLARGQKYQIIDGQITGLESKDIEFIGGNASYLGNGYVLIDEVFSVSTPIKVAYKSNISTMNSMFLTSNAIMSSSKHHNTKMTKQRINPTNNNKKRTIRKISNLFYKRTNSSNVEVSNNVGSLDSQSLTLNNSVSNNLISSDSQSSALDYSDSRNLIALNSQSLNTNNVVSRNLYSMDSNNSISHNLHSFNSSNSHSLNANNLDSNTLDSQSLTLDNSTSNNLVSNNLITTDSQSLYLNNVDSLVSHNLITLDSLKSNETFFYNSNSLYLADTRDKAIKNVRNIKSKNDSINSQNKQVPPIQDTQINQMNNDKYYFIFTPFINHTYFYESGNYNVSGLDYGFITAFSGKIDEFNTLGIHFAFSYGNLGDKNDRSFKIANMNLMLGLNYRLDLIYDMYLKARGDVYYFINEVGSSNILQTKPNNLGYGLSLSYGKDFDFNDNGILGLELGLDYKMLNTSKTDVQYALDNSTIEQYNNALYHLLYLDLGINYYKYFNVALGLWGFDSGLGVRGNLTPKISNGTLMVGNKSIDISLDNDNVLGYLNIGGSYLLESTNFNMEFSLRYNGSFGDKSISNGGSFEWRVRW